MGNAMPESTLSPSQGLLIWPLEKVIEGRKATDSGRKEEEDSKKYSMAKAGG